MNKILIICNESITVINFRKELIKFLINHGFEVSVVVGDDKFIKQIKELNVSVYYKKYSNRSKNLFSNIAVYRFFKKVLKSYKPDLVFTFQLKPNVYGTAAAKKEMIPVLNMVEGLGDPFISKSVSIKLVRRIVSHLYKKAFKYSNHVFFLNDDDKEEFIKRKLVDESIVTVINGIGIDTNAYIPSYSLNSEKKVLYLARLLKNKGIVEYCEIARLVRKKRPDILFELYGSESELTRKDIEEYTSDGSVFYGGLSNDVETLFKNSRIFAMTSYREGFPRTILESMALGRTVIAFDCVGVRSAVHDRETGFLIKQGDLDGFANKIIELIDDDEKLIRIGKRAREYCVDVCDSNYINGIIFEKIKSNLKNEG